MKSKLPSLTDVFSLPLLLVLAGNAMADDVGTPPEGNALIATAAINLANLPAFEAKLRQRVRLFGHEMVGSGTYLQMTAGRQRMLRLELKMDVAGEVASFQQISDGTTMWIRRDLGDEPALEYINLRHIRQVLSEQSTDRPPAMETLPTGGEWFALGGLDQLLVGLNRDFQFAPPTPNQIGTVPVWELTGEWNARALAHFGVTTASELPGHFPHRVKVMLGRDQQLPLFPYQIEYGRLSEHSGTATAPGDTSAYRAIAAMDLHGVQRRPDLGAQHFRFQPNNQDVTDVTERYVTRLKARRESSSTAEKR